MQRPRSLEDRVYNDGLFNTSVTILQACFSSGLTSLTSLHRTTYISRDPPPWSSSLGGGYCSMKKGIYILVNTRQSGNLILFTQGIQKIGG